MPDSIFLIKLQCPGNLAADNLHLLSQLPDVCLALLEGKTSVRARKFGWNSDPALLQNRFLKPGCRIAEARLW